MMRESCDVPGMLMVAAGIFSTHAERITCFSSSGFTQARHVRKFNYALCRVTSDVIELKYTSNASQCIATDYI
ncbi:hypothetical protein E2C01_042813 [Portunus trituberculatus]|uniref:Uncharacterized protein n=1 Tax=Portunus trituberculatus TaxID=210409 RepID=A0A5B7FUK6_PORTR|nr:hypothetical protein [Portunus trituberculatus]